MTVPRIIMLIMEDKIQKYLDHVNGMIFAATMI